MAKIRLKFPAYCADATCGAYLPVGSLARIYRGGKIYGYGCHTKDESIQGEHSRYREGEQQKGRVPPREVFNFGTPCGHEDFPCCGCSDAYNQRIG